MNAADSHLIFIVDDDQVLQRLVGRELQRHGYVTAGVNSGTAALDWLRHQQPDLMLLDLQLADMQGKELIRQLASCQRAVPFVVISGQGDERVAVEMMKHGALDYLVKDVDFAHFLPEVVKRALGQVERELKLAEAECALRHEHAFISAVLDTSGGLVVVLDPQGRIVRFNRACENTTGYSFAEVRGIRFDEVFLLPDEAQSVRTIFAQLCAGQFPNQHENHWLARDGRPRLIAWSNTALLDPQGKVEYVISTGIDVTERKVLEKEILEISDRERRRIGQDLHDGLGQHLAATELMSQVLEQRLEERRAPEAAQAAEITRLVRDAISQSRLLAHGLSPVTLESDGLMSALEELAVHTEQMFRIGCRFVCPEPVKVAHHAAATHLFRIAQEAVSNAVKHGKAKQITIQLAAQPTQNVLTICDNGVGFPRQIKKTGMGLRIMRYRAGMIGAELRFQPGRTEGTTVMCVFRKNL